MKEVYSHTLSTVNFHLIMLSQDIVLSRTHFDWSLCMIF